MTPKLSEKNLEWEKTSKGTVLKRPPVWRCSHSGQAFAQDDVSP